MSALYDTNAAVFRTAAFNSIGVGPLPYLVGYRQKADFVKGCNMVCPAFLGVGTGAAKLSNWKPTNAEAYVWGEITFESLDEYGRSVPGTSYAYADPTYAGDPSLCEWCDDTLSPSDKTFAPGEAVWLTMPGSSAGISPVGLSDAGEVNKDDITMTLRKGCNQVGNFMAVDYPVKDIEILNGSDYVWGEITFESLDEFGRSVAGTSYAYADPTYAGNPSLCQWCNDEMIPVENDNVIKSGEGIWFTSPMPVEKEGDGLQIKFYAPDL